MIFVLLQGLLIQLSMMHISTWNQRCTAFKISKMPCQATVMSPANLLPIRSASWACNRGYRRTGLGTYVQQSLPWNYWEFHLWVCRWSLMGLWHLGCGHVLSASAITWCSLLEPLHLPGRLAAQSPLSGPSPPHVTLLPCYLHRLQPVAGSSTWRKA